ncbi:MAG: hypothetical protein ACM3JJ_08160 [Hyphomicrobiales bacterium]
MRRHRAPNRIGPTLACVAIAAALAALLASGQAPAARAGGADSWDPIERVAGLDPVIVLVNGKPRVYFEVSERRPLEVSVVGPARVRVVTRAVVGAGTATPVSYTVMVSAGGARLGETKTESSPGKRVRRRDGKGIVCKSRSVVVSVPPGAGRLSIAVEGAPDILARVLVAAPRMAATEPMVSLTPIEAPRSVTVSEGEKLIPYYTTRHGQAVRFRVVGPTTLELTSRLDFDATMRGAHRYRLAIRVAGAPTREETFTTTKAVAATYAEGIDRIPSKVDRVVVQVGKGTHDVAVELLSPKQGAAEIHARIPQPSVGNEE